jgi:hypothetical protein
MTCKELLPQLDWFQTAVKDQDIPKKTNLKKKEDYLEELKKVSSRRTNPAC